MAPRRVLLVVDTPAVLAHTLPLLERLNQDGQWQVQVAASPSAAAAISLSTWSALTGQPAKMLTELSSADLQRTQLIMMAPVSPEFLRALATDGTLNSWTLISRCPILAAPIMPGYNVGGIHDVSDISNNDIEANVFPPNLEILRSGRQSLSLGSLGRFRLASPEYCFESLVAAFTPQDLMDLLILLTAGPTIEDADPARFISNRSTGRMGVALAQAAARRGALVTIVHGPMSWPVPDAPGIKAVPVRSAQEMCDAVLSDVSTADIAVLCAAVADYMPIAYSREKIKKGTESTFSLLLKRTPDILATLGALPRKPYLVGFAAETQDLEANATTKLRQKNCDLLCANDITEDGSGFAVPTNRLTVFYADGRKVNLPQLNKEKVANLVLDLIRKENPPI